MFGSFHGFELSFCDFLLKVKLANWSYSVQEHLAKWKVLYSNLRSCYQLKINGLVRTKLSLTVCVELPFKRRRKIVSN